MQAPWIYSSTFLPYTGEPIDFLLEDRSQPMHGTFADGMFHSRWADYAADRVQSWHGSDADPSAEPLDIPNAAPRQVWVALLKRLPQIFSMWQNASPMARSRTRSRTNAHWGTSEQVQRLTSFAVEKRFCGAWMHRREQRRKTLIRESRVRRCRIRLVMNGSRTDLFIPSLDVPGSHRHDRWYPRLPTA